MKLFIFKNSCAPFLNTLGVLKPSLMSPGHVGHSQVSLISIYAFEYKGTLFAVAEPALDVLWREQLTLGPLIQCMPADLWEVVPQGGVMKVLASLI
jgi:hypothetical protein